MKADERAPKLYDVFVRNWWRWEHGRRVPDPGARKRWLARGVTEAEARRMCQEWNQRHEPGKLGRKAEYWGSN